VRSSMKSKRKTASELVAELQANPEYVQRSLRQQQESAQSNAAFQAAARPVIEAINKTSVLTLNSAYAIGDAAARYPQIADILVEHLQRAYPESVTKTIAHALAIPQARRFWETLLRLFMNHPDGPVPNRTKFGIGCALAASADASVLADVLSIMRDPRHGANRGVFLKFLAESLSPQAQAAFEEAGHDPEFAKEVRFLKRIRQRKWRRGSDRTRQP